MATAMFNRIDTPLGLLSAFKNKSFLLLFFKKEGLSFFVQYLQLERSAPAGAVLCI
jgi:hypothetical protein